MAKANRSKKTIGDWDQADTGLACLVAMERQVAAEQADLERKITGLREKYAPGIDDLVADAKQIRADLEAFVRVQLADRPDGQRSRKLNAGTVGLRRTPPAVKGLPRNPKKVEALLADLRKRRLAHCVEFKAVILKGELAKLPAKKLTSLGLRTESKDEFYHRSREDEVRTAAADGAEG